MISSNNNITDILSITEQNTLISNIILLIHYYNI
nr:MAG TPA: hypothetical protein [Caudoviricetes sp.]